MNTNSDERLKLEVNAGKMRPDSKNYANRASPLPSGLTKSKIISQWLESLPSKLPWIFLLFGIPTVIFLAVCTPPFQSPDEWTHFARSYQVSNRGFYGGDGGYIDPGMVQAGSYYLPLEHGSNVKLTAAADAAGMSVRWGGPKVYSSFPNTSTNPPIGYIPQASAVIVGRVIGLSVVKTLILCRLFNGTVALFISALSIYWCRRGKLAMFALLLMPMSISLFASCSQDASLISVTALTFALISRQFTLGLPFSWRSTSLLAAALLFVMLERPPYAPLLLVLYLPGLLPRWRKSSPSAIGIGLACLILALTAIWWLGASSSKRMVLNSHPNATVDASLQLQYVVHHPMIIPVVTRNLARQGASYAVEIIGNLGWLDAPMPKPYYLIMGTAFLLALTGELAFGGRSSFRATALILSSAVLAVAAIVIIEYLTWTPVGSVTEEGLQGRYLIPPIIAFGVGLPCLIRSGWLYRWATAIVVLSQFATSLYLPLLIIDRYYLR